MAYGQRVGSIKQLKQSLKKGSGGTFIKYIPKNGSITVRFLTEPEEWINYQEHFDQQVRQSYPCNGEESCPGCLTEERKSSRYLVNALDVETDRVIPLQLPKDLTNRLVARYERYDTMMDRDYELSRSGEGLDTTYDLTPEPPMARKLAKYQLHDLEKVLEEAFNHVINGDNADDDEDDKAVTKARKASKAAPAKKLPKADKKADEKKDPEFEPDLDDDEDDDDVEEIDQEPDTDDGDDVEDDEDTDDEEWYTQEELEEMPFSALRNLAKEYGIPTKGVKQTDLVQAVLTFEPEEGEAE